VSKKGADSCFDTTWGIVISARSQKGNGLINEPERAKKSWLVDQTKSTPKRNR